MFDLHRHDEYSTFDGYGKADELAELAKELGHTALCTTNHGNTNGLIKTYLACKEAGIKSILGVEGYFLPKYKEKTRGYHMILIAKDLKGYGNLNRVQYDGERQKYYNGIWDFSMLKRYHEGLICTTACVASFFSQCIARDNDEMAEKFLRKLKSLFGDDLYVEVQPYPISEPGLQEKINVKSIKIAKKVGVKCILTSDSHRGSKSDLPTYMKMHQIAGHDGIDIEATYADRYMPTEDEIVDRFCKMHEGDFGSRQARRMAMEMVANLDEIDSKCKRDYLDELPLKLPQLHDEKSKSFGVLLGNVKDGLKRRGVYKKEYVERCKQELDVIKYHGFEDYFLIVADYVNWAKSNGIVVGPGRGSVCNSLVAYALGITEVDSLLFGLDFRRFLRKDKKKFPDIDLDFETSRRYEVIEYICKKYEGHAARICSYGLYKVDNLINDLAKVCGLPTSGDIDEQEKRHNKAEIAKLKSFVNSCIVEGTIDTQRLLESAEGRYYNKAYDDILVHFSKLFKKVRFIGTHAAGVAITGGNILDYTALRVDKNGDVFTSYDLEDIEAINVIKFDILGLKTMESIGDLRKATGVTVDYPTIAKDKRIIEAFHDGDCDGVFQFEKATARKILGEIDCDCFDDVVAATSMNRPGPLSLGMPAVYAESKRNPESAMSSVYYDYTKESYGTIIYQEQVQQICINIAGMTWGDADKLMKMLKGAKGSAIAQHEHDEARRELCEKFVKGAAKSGVPRKDAEELFDDMTAYTFNKGHGVGYSLISIEEMFYKVYYKPEYWFAKLKYAKNEVEYSKFCSSAVSDGIVIFLPHVNYSHPSSRLRVVDGEQCVQQGLAEINGVGEKAAQVIAEERKKNGVFINFDDFYDRCKCRLVTSRVIKILQEQGALEFNKKAYINRVTKYNSALYARNAK